MNGSMREISLYHEKYFALFVRVVTLIKTKVWSYVIRLVVPLRCSRIDGNTSALQRTRSDDDDNKVAILRYRVSSSKLIALAGWTKLS